MEGERRREVKNQPTSFPQHNFDNLAPCEKKIIRRVAVKASKQNSRDLHKFVREKNLLQSPPRRLLAGDDWNVSSPSIHQDLNCIHKNIPKGISLPLNVHLHSGDLRLPPHRIIAIRFKVASCFLRDLKCLVLGIFASKLSKDGVSCAATKTHWSNAKKLAWESDSDDQTKGNPRNAFQLGNLSFLNDP